MDVDAGDGLILHARKSGDGNGLILLHGFTGSLETWAPFEAQFAATHTVVAVDMPGHGLSSAPSDPERYSLDRFADDLASVMDAMGLERAVILGYSMGGRAALRFALLHPERVSALVLESVSPGFADALRRKERIDSDASLAESLERDGIERFVDRWERLSLWDSQKNLPARERMRLREQRLRNSPRGLANSLRGAGAGALPALESRLADISAPALILAGELDAAYTHHGAVLERAIPHSRMSVIPRAGHAVHLEQPVAFAQAVVAFLTQLAEPII